MTTAIYGETFLHEFADGRLMELRRDHSFNPDIHLEARSILPNGQPFDDGDQWYRITGDGWTWLERTCPELLQEIREECI